MGWIDVSVMLKSGMVRWPGDPKLEVKRSHAMAKGADANISRISMGSHTGTHMDAPYHFISAGKGIDQMPFDATVGKARVIEIRDHMSIKPNELKAHKIHHGERILFKTLNSKRCWRTNVFIEDFVYISAPAAEFLAERGIKSVGIDYLSVGGYREDGTRTHQALLRAGIWIIEGLNLAKVRPAEYELICLPLKLWHGDGAPARAILSKRYRKKRDEK